MVCALSVMNNLKQPTTNLPSLYTTRPQDSQLAFILVTVGNVGITEIHMAGHQSFGMCLRL